LIDFTVNFCCPYGVPVQVIHFTPYGQQKLTVKSIKPHTKLFRITKTK